MSKLWVCRYFCDGHSFPKPRGSGMAHLADCRFVRHCLFLIPGSVKHVRCWWPVRPTCCTSRHVPSACPQPLAPPWAAQPAHGPPAPPMCLGPESMGPYRYVLQCHLLCRMALDRAPSWMGDHMVLLRECPVRAPRSPAHLTDWPLWVRITWYTQNNYFCWVNIMSKQKTSSVIMSVLWVGRVKTLDAFSMHRRDCFFLLWVMGELLWVNPDT